MTSLRSLLAAGALLATAGVLVAPTPSATAAPARPQVGSCHALTYDEGAAASDPDPAVSCERSHTSRTIKVLVVGRKVASNPDAAFRAAVKRCQPAFRKAAGGTAASRAVSAYSFYIFVPTRAQLRKGADWVRCDIVLLGGRQLLPLPTDQAPALGDLPHPDRVALCATVTSRSFAAKSCSKAHNYRANKAFKVASKAYPGRERLLRIAQRRCPGIAGRNWYASWDGQIGWRFSDRQMVCYKMTRG